MIRTAPHKNSRKKIWRPARWLLALCLAASAGFLFADTARAADANLQAMRERLDTIRDVFDSAENTLKQSSLRQRLRFAPRQHQSAADRNPCADRPDRAALCRNAKTPHGTGGGAKRWRARRRRPHHGRARNANFAPRRSRRRAETGTAAQRARRPAFGQNRRRAALAVQGAIADARRKHSQPVALAPRREGASRRDQRLRRAYRRLEQLRDREHHKRYDFARADRDRGLDRRRCSSPPDAAPPSRPAGTERRRPANAPLARTPISRSAGR